MAISPPPGVAPGFGSGGPPSAVDPDQPLWDSLVNTPISPINIPTTAASLQLLNRPCILSGWSLRETTGTAPAQVEFFDGGSAGGVLVGEVTLPAPLAGSVGFTDVDVDASAANPAAANNVTLPGVAGATTFITGFEITGDGATAGSIITITVTGVLGGTKSYFLTIPAGVGVAITPLQVEFTRPIPASALNTAIVVNVPSFGVGNTNAAATAHGFQRTAGGSASSAGSSVSQSAGIGALCRGGLFMRVVAGSVVGAVWIKA